MTAGAGMCMGSGNEMCNVCQDVSHRIMYSCAKTPLDCSVVEEIQSSLYEARYSITAHYSVG